MGEENIHCQATCQSATGIKGNTAAGMTGKVKFEIALTDAEDLMPLIGQESFGLTFGQAGLGEGWTISGITARPDADGNSRAFLVMVAPETSAPAMGLLFSRSLIGTHGPLVLERNQQTISAMLTHKAE